MSLAETTLALVKKAGVGLIQTLNTMEDGKVVNMIQSGLGQILRSSTKDGLEAWEGLNLKKSKRLLTLLRQAATQEEERLEAEAKLDAETRRPPT